MPRPRKSGWVHVYPVHTVPVTAGHLREDTPTPRSPPKAPHNRRGRPTRGVPRPRVVRRGRPAAPGRKLREQGAIQDSLIEPGLVLAVRVGEDFPRSVSPCEKRDRLLIPFRDEPAYREAGAAPLPAQPRDRRVVRHRGVGGVHDACGELCIVEGGGSVADPRPTKRTYRPMIR